MRLTIQLRGRALAFRLGWRGLSVDTEFRGCRPLAAWER